MNHLQTELLLKVARSFALFLCFWFCFWAWIWQMAFLKKPLILAFYSSYMNWLLFVLCVIIYGILGFLSDHPELVRRPRIRRVKKPDSEAKVEKPEAKKKEERLPLY